LEYLNPELLTKSDYELLRIPWLVLHLPCFLETFQNANGLQPCAEARARERSEAMAHEKAACLQMAKKSQELLDRINATVRTVELRFRERDHRLLLKRPQVSRYDNESLI